MVVLTALDCAATLVAGLLTFCAVQFQPVVVAGSVNTSGWLPEQEVPTSASKRAVPLLLTIAAEVQPPEARVGAVPETVTLAEVPLWTCKPARATVPAMLPAAPVPTPRTPAEMRERPESVLPPKFVVLSHP